MLERDGLDQVMLGASHEDVAKEIPKGRKSWAVRARVREILQAAVHKAVHEDDVDWEQPAPEVRAMALEVPAGESD